MKKIVLLSPANPLRGGIAASGERLAMELQAAGYEVVIYSFSLQYPGFLFPGKTQFSGDPPPSGLEIRSRINSIYPLNWLKVGLELRRLHPDLIISRYWLPFMGPCLGTILRLARGKGCTRIIAIADNVLPHEKRPGDRQFTTWFLNSVDACIVMSRSVLNDLQHFSMANKPVAFIPLPIHDNYGEKATREVALARLGLPAEFRYLLFFGFIRNYKGLDLLLEAMSDERIRRKGLRLIIAGEYYGDREFYEELIHTLNIEDQLVMHTDYIPTEEVKYYFGAADLVVLPYKSATQSGISQVAYHFEKPMIVTDVGGLSETVPHGKVGYVVPAEAGAIANAVVDFFENKRQATLEEGVREEKKRYSWQTMVDGIEKLYRQLMTS